MNEIPGFRDYHRTTCANCGKPINRNQHTKDGRRRYCRSLCKRDAHNARRRHRRLAAKAQRSKHASLGLGGEGLSKSQLLDLLPPPKEDSS